MYDINVNIILQNSENFISFTITIITKILYILHLRFSDKF